MVFGLGILEDGAWRELVAGRDGGVGVSGPTGAVGATGPNGGRGATGPSGEIGAMGENGPTGPMRESPRGATGPLGPTGPTGPEGLVAAGGARGVVANYVEGAAGEVLLVYPKVELNIGVLTALYGNSSRNIPWVAAEAFEIRLVRDGLEWKAVGYIAIKNFHGTDEEQIDVGVDLSARSTITNLIFFNYNYNPTLYWRVNVYLEPDMSLYITADTNYGSGVYITQTIVPVADFSPPRTYMLPDADATPTSGHGDALVTSGGVAAAFCDLIDKIAEYKPSLTAEQVAAMKAIYGA